MTEFLSSISSKRDAPLTESSSSGEYSFMEQESESTDEIDNLNALFQKKGKSWDDTGSSADLSASDTNGQSDSIEKEKKKYKKDRRNKKDKDKKKLMSRSFETQETQIHKSTSAPAVELTPKKGITPPEHKAPIPIKRSSFSESAAAPIPPSLDPVSEWTNEEVVKWVSSVPKLSQNYVEIFKTQQITGKALLLMKESHLEKLNVHNLNDNLILSNAISQLQLRDKLDNIDLSGSDLYGDSTKDHDEFFIHSRGHSSRFSNELLSKLHDLNIGIVSSADDSVRSLHSHSHHSSSISSSRQSSRPSTTRISREALAQLHENYLRENYISLSTSNDSDASRSRRSQDIDPVHLSWRGTTSRLPDMSYQTLPLDEPAKSIQRSDADEGYQIRNSSDVPTSRGNIRTMFGSNSSPLVQTGSSSLLSSSPNDSENSVSGSSPVVPRNATPSNSRKHLSHNDEPLLDVPPLPTEPAPDKVFRKSASSPRSPRSRKLRNDRSPDLSRSSSADQKDQANPIRSDLSPTLKMPLQDSADDPQYDWSEIKRMDASIMVKSRSPKFDRAQIYDNAFIRSTSSSSTEEWTSGSRSESIGSASDITRERSLSTEDPDRRKLSSSPMAVFQILQKKHNDWTEKRKENKVTDTEKKKQQEKEKDNSTKVTNVINPLYTSNAIALGLISPPTSPISSADPSLLALSQVKSKKEKRRSWFWKKSKDGNSPPFVSSQSTPSTSPSASPTSSPKSRKDGKRSYSSISTLSMPQLFRTDEHFDPRVYLFEGADTDAVILFDESPLTPDQNESNRKIRGATIEKLIQRLTYHKYPDPEYVYTFLLIYQRYTSPKEVLNLLRMRYNTPFDSYLFDETAQINGKHPTTEDFIRNQLTPIRLRIVNVFKVWLKSYIADFRDPEVMFMMRDFMDLMRQTGMEGPAEQLEKIIEQQEGTEKGTVHQFNQLPETPYLPKNINSRSLSIKDFHPLEIARQLTVIESELFRRIQPRECLQQRWMKGNKDKEAINILSMIRHFNQVSNWITTEILQVEDVSERAVMLNRFIVIAAKCLELNNFNGAMEVFSSLQNASINRLRGTWDLLPSKSLEAFENLNQLMNGDDNFALYRTTLKDTTPPVVPYLGVMLTDLTFLEEGNPELITNTALFNFAKARLISGVIREMQTWQQTPFCLESVWVIRDYIKNFSVLTEDELYRKSLHCEPRSNKMRRYTHYSSNSDSDSIRSRRREMTSSSERTYNYKSSLNL